MSQGEVIQADALFNDAVLNNTAAGSFGSTLSKTATKTVTWTGASGLGANATTTSIFTVAGGLVVIEEVSGRVTTNHTVSNVLATLKLGVVGSDALFIPLTVGNTLLTTAPIWMSTTATAGGLLKPAPTVNTVVAANVITTVGGTGDITGGVMELNCKWHALTPGATLVAA